MDNVWLSVWDHYYCLSMCLNPAFTAWVLVWIKRKRMCVFLRQLSIHGCLFMSIITIFVCVWVRCQHMCVCVCVSGSSNHCMRDCLDLTSKHVCVDGSISTICVCGWVMYRCLCAWMSHLSLYVCVGGSIIIVCVDVLMSGVWTGQLSIYRARM